MFQFKVNFCTVLLTSGFGWDEGCAEDVEFVEPPLFKGSLADSEDLWVDWHCDAFNMALDLWLWTQET